MIDRDHALPITRQARLLGINRGAGYCLPRPTSPTELDLMRRIDELPLGYPFRDARMLRRQLQRQDMPVGRRHMAMLMQRMGVQAPAPQPGTRQRAPGHKFRSRKLQHAQAVEVGDGQEAVALQGSG